MRKGYILGALALLLVAGYVTWSYMFPSSDIAKKPFAPQQFELAGGPEKENRGFPQREIIDLVTEYPDVFYRQGSMKEAKVALSFDDGPDNDYTVKILDILKKHKVKATFFLIGKRCEMYPEIVERMVKEGHIIGNHTWSHPNIIKLSNAKALKELKDTEKILKKQAGYIPKLFRSPYGSLDREKVELFRDEGYKIISWNVDSLDWKGLSAAEVKTNILENMEQGSIILQHSAGGVGEDLSGSVEALDDIIKVLKKDGYKFVTVDKLLDIPYKK
ncbi:MAG: polysaccharide deacetylase family protein [Peptococcales bacterium]|jgi:peptidoglycan/xylan/chitin deacetylase (PgdA/CDA1 family)